MGKLAYCWLVLYKAHCYFMTGFTHMGKSQTDSVTADLGNLWLPVSFVCLWNKNSQSSRVCVLMCFCLLDDLIFHIHYLLSFGGF